MPEYGQGDATFHAAGGEAGIRQLVDHFYDIMENNPAYQTIWSWHPEDREISRDKLARFLCGWMGGPRSYNEVYGSISIPGVHAHLKVTTEEMNQWLSCMAEALDRMDFPAELKEYLLVQLSVPANVIRKNTTTSES